MAQECHYREGPWVTSVPPNRGYEHPIGAFQVQPADKKYAISFTLDGFASPDNNEPTTVRI
jgi:hypothetical protein